MAARRLPRSPETTGQKVEGRDSGEPCALNVNQLIPEAHRLARDAGMIVGSAKVSTLTRRYVRAVKDGAKVPPFAEFFLNAVMSVPPMQIVRGAAARNAFGFTDETGETVAHHLSQMLPIVDDRDDGPGIGPSFADLRREAVRVMREEARRG